MNIVEKQLSTILSRNWWVLLLRGIIAIAFGVVVWLLHRDLTRRTGFVLRRIRPGGRHSRGLDCHFRTQRA